MNRHTLTAFLVLSAIAAAVIAPTLFAQLKVSEVQSSPPIFPVEVGVITTAPRQAPPAVLSPPPPPSAKTVPLPPPPPETQPPADEPTHQHLPSTGGAQGVHEIHTPPRRQPTSLPIHH